MGPGSPGHHHGGRGQRRAEEACYLPPFRALLSTSKSAWLVQLWTHGPCSFHGGQRSYLLIIRKCSWLGTWPSPRLCTAGPLCMQGTYQGKLAYYLRPDKNTREWGTQRAEQKQAANWRVSRAPFRPAQGEGNAEIRSRCREVSASCQRGEATEVQCVHIMQGGMVLPLPPYGRHQ